MPWVRLEDDMPDHPKVIGLSNGAFRVFVEALCYANRYLTDGQVPATVIPTRRRRYVTELLDAGLWSKNGEGYTIHDYLEYQPSRSAASTAQQKRSEAARKAALSRWHS
jgi:hypothetical protein